MAMFAVQGAQAATNFTFAAPTIIQFPNNHWPSHFAAADITADGNIDLVVSGRNTDFRAFTIIGNGDGTFAEPQPLILSGQIDWVALGDFDGDGILDTAFAIRSFNGRVAVLRGLGDGSFDAENAVEYRVGRLTQGVFATDLTGNGRPDLIATNYNSGTYRVLLNDGDGGFSMLDPVMLTEWVGGLVSPNDPVAADLTGDGLPDLANAALGGGRISVAHNAGAGLFAEPRAYRLPSVNGLLAAAATVTLADMDGDGAVDLLLPLAIDGAQNRVGVMRNPGDGRFPPAQHFPAGTSSLAWTAAAADFDGDGRLDVALGTAFPGGFALLRNISEPGSLAFDTPQQLPNSNFFVRTIAPVDLNGDGSVDLVYTNYAQHRILARLNLTPQGALAAGPAPRVAPDHARPVAIDDAPANDGEHAAWDFSPLENLTDVNGDGRIDVFDALIVLERMGEEPR
jgi:hypothetical protein